MLSHLRPAIALMLFFTLLTGLAYPLAMTAIAQGLFPVAANGSLIDRDGTIVGSALIAQGFTGAAYLHPRPSASGWNAAGTGASNLGPTSAALIAAVAERRAAWEALNGAPAPIDAITTSGSGLDPDISTETALAQADRIAAARGADPAAVRALIADAVQGRALGLYGEPRVNVLLTNIALDEAFPMPPAGS
jgi:K+-transporting ATPase ATPase C chain